MLETVERERVRERERERERHMGGRRKIKRDERIEMAWKRVVTVDVGDSGERESERERERERERDIWVEGER